MSDIIIVIILTAAMSLTAFLFTVVALVGVEIIAEFFEYKQVR